MKMPSNWMSQGAWTLVPKWVKLQEKMRELIFVILGVLALFLSTLVAVAELPVELVEVGMSHAAVLRELGPAQKKIEFETKREELWEYPSGIVRFRNGRVVVVEATAATKAMTADMVELDRRPEEPSLSSKTPRQTTVEDILNEVMLRTDASGASSKVSASRKLRRR
jgi:hypothetical protein